jgi:phosphatidylserine decarboxylase
VSVTLVAGAGGLNVTPYVRRGDEARAGHKLAFLAEGGLVLLTLPAGAIPQVSVGDRVTGAETVVARL